MVTAITTAALLGWLPILTMYPRAKSFSYKPSSMNGLTPFSTQWVGGYKKTLWQPLSKCCTNPLQRSGFLKSELNNVNCIINFQPLSLRRYEHRDNHP